MRKAVIVVSLTLALAVGISYAQSLSAPPTKVAPLGVCACPTHPEIQATWPARCPTCQNVLTAVSPSASTVVGVVPTSGRDEEREERERREAARRNEGFRERRGENEEEEEREQARRNEELRERYPYYGYYPPQGYVSPYPYNYYYNPNMGHYFYNPNTGQYVYINPRYISTDTDAIIGPGIDMDSRRREEEEEAQKAQQEEETREQARRNAQLWEPCRNYYPPGGYPYTYAVPGYAYQYPNNYCYNPNTGQYEYRNPAYAFPYGAYSYNPGTGQYYYNPNTGPYQYVNPGYAYPNRGSAGSRERRERERR